MGKIKKKKHFFRCGQPHNMLHSLMFREFGYYKDQKRNTEGLASVAERNLVLKMFKELKCDLPGFPKATFLMVFSPDGTKVASTHGNHNVYITELATGKNIKTLSGHCRTPWCIAFCPSSSEILATGCLGGQVRVWDLNGACEVWNVESQIGIASLAFHPSKRLLVIATNNKIYFWDWSQPKPYAIASTRTEKEKVRYVAFDNLGTKLITGIANIRIWERADDRPRLRRVLRYPCNGHQVLNGMPRLHLWNHGSTYGTRMPYNYAERTTRNLNYWEFRVALANRDLNEGTSNTNDPDPLHDERNGSRINEDTESPSGEAANSSHTIRENFQSPRRRGDEPPPRRVTRSRAHSDDSEDDPPRRRRRSLEPSSTPLSTSSTDDSSSSSDEGFPRSARHSNISDFTISSLCHSTFQSSNISRRGPQRPAVAPHEISAGHWERNPVAAAAAAAPVLLRSESSRITRNAPEVETIVMGGPTPAEFFINSEQVFSRETANISPESPADDNGGEQSDNGYRLLEEDSNLGLNSPYWASRWIRSNSSNRNVERTTNLSSDPTRGISDVLEAIQLLFSGLGTASTTASLQPSLTNNTLEGQEERGNETQYSNSTTPTFSSRIQLISTQHTLLCLKTEVEQLLQIRSTWGRLKARNICKQLVLRQSADQNSNGNPEPSTSSQRTFSSRAKLPILNNDQVNRMNMVLEEFLHFVATNREKWADWNRPSTSGGVANTTTTTTTSPSTSTPSTLAAGSSTPGRPTLDRNNRQHYGRVSDDKCLHSLLTLLQDDGQLQEFISLYLLEIVDALCPRCHRTSGENGQCPASGTANDHTYSNVTGANRFSPVTPVTPATERVPGGSLDTSSSSRNNNNNNNNNDSETDATTSTDSEILHDFQYEKLHVAGIMRFKILARCMEHWNTSNVNRDEGETGTERGGRQPGSTTRESSSTSSTSTVIHGATALRAGRALCVIGQSLIHWFEVKRFTNWPQLIDLILHMCHLLQIAFDLTDLLVRQAQNQVRKLYNDLCILMDTILPILNSTIRSERSRNTNRPNSGIFSFNTFETLSYRVQAWHFSDVSEVPDITDPKKNVIVQECKIHNDASINISADGKLLTAMFPSATIDGVGKATEVGVYSLDWKTLGKKICSTKMADTVVSVSLSPLQQHLLVGLAKIYVSKPYVMARIYKLKGKDLEDENFEQPECSSDPAVGNLGEQSNAPRLRNREPTSKVESKDIKMIPIRLLYPTDFDTTGAVSLNCIRWAPQPGQGLVYGTNMGELNILH